MRGIGAKTGDERERILFGRVRAGGRGGRTDLERSAAEKTRVQRRGSRRGRRKERSSSGGGRERRRRAVMDMTRDEKSFSQRWDGEVFLAVALSRSACLGGLCLAWWAVAGRCAWSALPCPALPCRSFPLRWLAARRCSALLGPAPFLPYQAKKRRKCDRRARPDAAG